MRSVTGGFIKLLDHYPRLEGIIFFFVGWMGLKLVMEGFSLYFMNRSLQEPFEFIFWIGAILIFLIGFILLLF